MTNDNCWSLLSCTTPPTTLTTTLNFNEAIPALRKLLSQSDIELYRNALWSLGRMKTADVVPDLLAALDHQEPYVQQAAILALGQTGKPAAAGVPKLLARLKSSDDRSQNLAVAALGQIAAEPKTVVPRLIELLDDEKLKYSAAHAVAQYGAEGRNAIPKLIEMLGERESRYAATAALAKFGPLASDSIPHLKKALQRASRYERRSLEAAIKSVAARP